MPATVLLLWMLGAYLVAAIPVGLLVARIRGIDLRATGSGNIGATNAGRALGRGWGIAVFALDVAKAAGPVALALRRFAELPQGPSWVALIAAAAILGHVFPVYLRFRGGKGVACAFGVFLVLAPQAALAGLLLYLQTLWLTRISAVGSLTSATMIALVAWIDGDVPRAYALLAAALAALVWLRHRSNIERLRVLARDNRRREQEL